MNRYYIRVIINDELVCYALSMRGDKFWTPMIEHARKLKQELQEKYPSYKIEIIKEEIVE